MAKKSRAPKKSQKAQKNQKAQKQQKNRIDDTESTPRAGCRRWRVPDFYG